MNLNNKTILITGASSGIGKELAIELASNNNNFILTARRKEKLDEVKAEVEKRGSKCMIIVADSTDEQAASEVLTQGIEAFNKIDLALLNAGAGGLAKTIDNYDISTIKYVLSANVDTILNYLSPLIKHMKEQGGGVIAHTCSPAGFFGVPLTAPYSAAKSYGKVLFQNCRMELAKYNIRCLSIYPGFTYTELFTEELRKERNIPKFIAIDLPRAIKEIIYALEKEKNNHFFPKRLQIIHTFARVLPEPLRILLLRRMARL